MVGTGHPGPLPRESQWGPQRLLVTVYLLNKSLTSHLMHGARSRSRKSEPSPGTVAGNHARDQLLLPERDAFFLPLIFLS